MDSLTIGPDGEVFVNINNNYRVAKYSPDGELLAIWGRPAGIAVSPDGEVLITINNNFRVVMYSREGKLEAEWIGEGGEPGQIRSPVGVAIGPERDIYVADKGNSNVQVFRYS